MRRIVLVVTQDPRLRSLLKGLRCPDLRLIGCGTGLAALVTCACRPVDLLVVDLETPGMHWPTLLDKLSNAFPGMPVVAVTAAGKTAALTGEIREKLEFATRRKEPEVARAAAGFLDEKTA